ncbi:hypothetical protein YTCETSXE_CDS0085 [Staphylococcus phage MVC_VPHSA2]|nr:hypothetical protein YTCETSXE_CDS0085 [Staphylococcus phage MVC_VPHSA2]
MVLTGKQFYSFRLVEFHIITFYPFIFIWTCPSGTYGKCYLSMTIRYIDTTSF